MLFKAKVPPRNATANSPLVNLVTVLDLSGNASAEELCMLKRHVLDLVTMLDLISEENDFGEGVLLSLVFQNLRGFPPDRQTSNWAKRLFWTSCFSCVEESIEKEQNQLDICSVVASDIDLFIDGTFLEHPNLFCNLIEKSLKSNNNFDSKLCAKALASICW